LADPQTTQKILAIAKADEEAHNNHDAAAAAALFTRDAVFLTPEGPIIGRQAIQKWYTNLWQSWHSTNYITKADGNALHVIGTAGTELWATGEWSETGQGKNGEPLPIKGYWSAIYVREGDDWKVRMAETNTTPDSVILLNKTFAPQPTALCVAHLKMFLLQTRPVPHRRWRKRSHGAKTILSASRPITTMTSMTPITWSMAFNSRP
jgi:uncharacterized protein (TIGR02246 family)